MKEARLKVWNWVKSAGIAVLSAVSLLSFIPAALCQETNSTTTTTTSAINWTIDPAPLINLVIALLPALLVIMIIKAVLGSLASFARFSKIHAFFAKAFSFFRANRPKIDWSRIAPLALLCLLVTGVTLGVAPVAAQETSTTVNFDVSGLVNLVMALLPLIIILVIMKALIQAFSGIAK